MATLSILVTKPVTFRRAVAAGFFFGIAAAISAKTSLLAASLAVWAVNPYAALLLVPAAHVWLLVASPELRPRPPGALALVAVGLLPLAALVAFYAHGLGLGPGEAAWTAVLLVAGGHVGVAASLAWSVLFGCAAAMALCALRAPAARAPEPDEPVEITIRGPRSYAGPGSLGGTESALRR